MMMNDKQHVFDLYSFSLRRYLGWFTFPLLGRLHRSHILGGAQR